MPATDPYSDSEVAWLDELDAAEPRGDAHAVLVAPVEHRLMGGPPPRQPDPSVVWMSSVPNMDAFVTVRATITLSDGTALDGFVKIYARSGDLHQAWIRINGRWDRLAHLPRPRDRRGLLRGWETVVAFELDPDWGATPYVPGTDGATMPRELNDGGRLPLVIRAGGAAGGLLVAFVGAWMGSMNAGWFGLQRDTNALFPLLGLGVALVVAAWAAAGWPAKLWRAGIDGRSAVGLLVVAPGVYILSWVIEFAIFGTLALGLGLILLAVAMWWRRLSDRVDRVLVTLAAAGSLTWNTETRSAFLLVGVGLVFASLCLRLRPQHEPRQVPDATG
ncbi:MAG: hypothetical protein KY469_09625 [Actinobacteria bacterium]|nr:hypothetical protein [Actinomycetota bacterium]